MTQHRLALLGTGPIAACHALAAREVAVYYDLEPDRVKPVVVASESRERARAFADRFGFPEAQKVAEFWRRDDVDTVIIAGRNEVHCDQLERALRSDSIRHIYVEKPVCVGRSEVERLSRWQAQGPPGKRILVGFQFLQTGAMRQAIRLARGGSLGMPICFSARYHHANYLGRDYRDRRRSRLQPAPAGGATADLGCHALSHLVAVLGRGLAVVAARSSGSIADVPPTSDLCTVALMQDEASGAIGSVSASRVSCGAGDLLEVEARYTDGAIRLTTERPDQLEFFDTYTDSWSVRNCGNDYSPWSTFPAREVAAGWLRSLVHAHYLLFGGSDPDAFLPDLQHGLAVQRLVHCITEQAGLIRR